MAQPAMGRITCSHCNAWYNSERELREHKMTAHRERGSGQPTSQRDDAQQDSPIIQPREEQKNPDH